MTSTPTRLGSVRTGGALFRHDGELHWRRTYTAEEFKGFDGLFGLVVTAESPAGLRRNAHEPSGQAPAGRSRDRPGRRLLAHDGPLDVVGSEWDIFTGSSTTNSPGIHNYGVFMLTCRLGTVFGARAASLMRLQRLRLLGILPGDGELTGSRTGGGLFVRFREGRRPRCRRH